MASSSMSTAISLTSAITTTVTKAVSAVASSSPTATAGNNVSTPVSGADSSYNGFPSKDLFFFVVVGIPVIAITAISIFLGCCCCCKFSWKDAHRRRQQRHTQALEIGVASKAVPPAAATMISMSSELEVPDRVYYSESAVSVEEPPPKYDSAVKQRGRKDVDEPQLKYNFMIDRQV